MGFLAEQIPRPVGMLMEWQFPCGREVRIVSGMLPTLTGRRGVVVEHVLMNANQVPGYLIELYLPWAGRRRVQMYADEVYSTPAIVLDVRAHDGRVYTVEVGTNGGTVLYVLDEQGEDRTMYFLLQCEMQDLTRSALYAALQRAGLRP